MANAWNPTRERHRVAVNTWIRESGAFDGVADFDAALRDPETPTQMRAVDDSVTACTRAIAAIARWATRSTSRCSIESGVTWCCVFRCSPRGIIQGVLDQNEEIDPAHLTGVLLRLGTSELSLRLRLPL